MRETFKPYPMQNLPDLLAERQRIDAQIAAQNQVRQSAAIERARQVLAEAGLTFRDVTPAAKARPAVAPKYRGPNGETWAGRGQRPKWLEQLLAAGHTIEQFRVGA
jgi:DNA-binding protein H-NS